MNVSVYITNYKCKVKVLYFLIYYLLCFGNYKQNTVLYTNSNILINLKAIKVRPWF